MMGDFIQKECCGATFGHRRTCSHYLAPDIEIIALRNENAHLTAENARLTAEIAESKLRCDECGATFDNSKIGVDALWSHCCQ